MLFFSFKKYSTDSCLLTQIGFLLVILLARDFNISSVALQCWYNVRFETLDLVMPHGVADQLCTCILCPQIAHL